MLGPSLWMKKIRVPPPPTGSYICTYILFVVVTFIFGIIPHLLYFAINVLYFVFRKVSFLYCILPFAF